MSTPNGQQQDIRRTVEGSHAKAAKGSYMEMWTDAEVQRGREGKVERLYPSGTVVLFPGLRRALRGGK